MVFGSSKIREKVGGPVAKKNGHGNDVGPEQQHQGVGTRRLADLRPMGKCDSMGGHPNVGKKREECLQGRKS